MLLAGPHLEQQRHKGVVGHQPNVDPVHKPAGGVGWQAALRWCGRNAAALAAKPPYPCIHARHSPPPSCSLSPTTHRCTVSSAEVATSGALPAYVATMVPHAAAMSLSARSRMLSLKCMLCLASSEERGTSREMMSWSTDTRILGGDKVAQAHVRLLVRARL